MAEVLTTRTYYKIVHKDDYGNMIHSLYQGKRSGFNTVEEALSVVHSGYYPTGMRFYIVEVKESMITCGVLNNESGSPKGRTDRAEDSNCSHYEQSGPGSGF